VHSSQKQYKLLYNTIINTLLTNQLLKLNTKATTSTNTNKMLLVEMFTIVELNYFFIIKDYLWFVYYYQ